MDFARITDSFQTFLDKAQDSKSGSTLAVVGTGIRNSGDAVVRNSSPAAKIFGSGNRGVK